MTLLDNTVDNLVNKLMKDPLIHHRLLFRKDVRVHILFKINKK